MPTLWNLRPRLRGDRLDRVVAVEALHRLEGQERAARAAGAADVHADVGEAEGVEERGERRVARGCSGRSRSTPPPSGTGRSRRAGQRRRWPTAWCRRGSDVVEARGRASGRRRTTARAAARVKAVTPAGPDSKAGGRWSSSGRCRCRASSLRHTRLPWASTVPVRRRAGRGPAGGGAPGVAPSTSSWVAPGRTTVTGAAEAEVEVDCTAVSVARARASAASRVMRARRTGVRRGMSGSCHGRPPGARVPGHAESRSR